MSVKNIKIYNSPLFLEDLKRATGVIVMPRKSNVILKVAKNDVRKEAETDTINYYMTDTIYRNRRTVMVIE